MTNVELYYTHVDKRVKRISKGIEYKLVQGFFEDSLKNGANSYNIFKSKIIFIDSDTYSSASEALLFCSKTIQEGTFIILDDYYSYKGSRNKGVARAFFELIEKNGLDVRKVFTYGIILGTTL